MLADFLGTVGWIIVFTLAGAAGVGYLWLKSARAKK